jgi:hypothetical protein
MRCAAPSGHGAGDARKKGYDGHPESRQFGQSGPANPFRAVKNIQAPEIQRLIDDMVETMREYACGLAAPQVH